MVDIVWPADLMPYRVQFYLQAHTGGQESPFTRTRKTYGLSAPRWIAKLTFRAGYDGAPLHGDPAGFGARLDGLIADLKGGLVKTLFHDFRRPRPLQGQQVVQPLAFEAAAKGATFVAIRGFAPHSRAFSVGDYVGGDGRPHLVSIAATIAAGGVTTGAGTIMADETGRAVVGINPPLSAAIEAGAGPQWPVRGRFELPNNDAGQNETEVGEMTEYTLDFIEALA